MVSKFCDRPLYNGWRLGILINTVCAAAVLAVNLGVTLWAVSNISPSGPDGGWSRRKLFEGPCSKVKAVNVVGHLVVNALSTVLLGASNYCMQVLAAPNRREVDAAHARKKWLDIGTPSVRNLRSISRTRVALWGLLGLSSLPLHMFYNSALFSSFGATEYVVVAVVERFVQPGGEPGHSGPPASPTWQDRVVADLHGKAVAGRLIRLENAECLDAYAQGFQSTNSNIVLVVDGDPYRESNYTDDVVGLQVATYQLSAECSKFRQAWYWVCSDLQHSVCMAEERLSEIRADVAAWTVMGRRVRYCLSEPAQDQCSLYFSTTVAAIVNAINLVKMLGILAVFWVIREKPLLNLGDAISSFMEVPDETTKGLGLVSRADFNTKSGWPAEPNRVPFDSHLKKRWVAAPGRKRIIWAVVLFLLLLAACAGFLGGSITVLEGYGTADFNAIWTMGFGTVDGRTLIAAKEFIAEGTMPLLVAIFTANVSQPIISGAYFLFNALITMMAMASEFDGFAVRRKGLRVSSSPAGAQRGSHLLQLPYKLIVPFMIVSGLLHWAASQAVFVVDVELRLADGMVRVPEHKTDIITTCGYS